MIAALSFLALVAIEPVEVHEVVLDNGLTVLTSENHERPQVFGAVVVRTGGKNDPADDTGMAHYLEHMLFKGTTRLGTTDWEAERPWMERIVELYERLRSAQTDAQRAAIQSQIGEAVSRTYDYTVPNELDKILGEIGGTEINAFTTEDETVYHNLFPSSQVGTWLEIQAHRFQDPVFRLFPTELEAVYEEKNISMDRFEVTLFETFMRRAFPEHPYGTQSVIGEVEHLKRPSLTAMGAYFDRYYVPNNMALVLVGDFETDEVLPVVEREFGVWKRGAQPVPRPGVVQPFEGRESFAVRLTPLRAGALGFRTVPLRHPDHAAVTVVRELLYNEQGSGYLDRLVDDGALLILFPFPQDFSEHALDIMFFAPRLLGQTYRQAESLVLEQVARIGRGDFDDAQLRAVRDALRQRAELALEDNEERALVLAHTFVRGMSWRDHVQYLERLATITRDDVVRVAKTHFGDDYLLMRSRVGFPRKQHLDKPHYPAVRAREGARSELYRQLSGRPRPSPRLRPIDFDRDVQTATVGPGVVVHRNENPSNDIYTLELRFGVGEDSIRELSVLADYLPEVGTRVHTAQGFKRKLFLINTSLRVESTLERFVLILQGPERHLGRALLLVDELMHRPAADPARLRQLRRERWGLERVERRDPAHVAEAVREYAFLGDRSPFLRGYGPRGMRRLDVERLLDVWARAQTHEVEIRYVGTKSAQQVAQVVGDTLHFADRLEPAVAKVVYPRVLPETPTVFFLPRRGAIQTHLYFGVDGEPVAPASRAAADAYDEYMGGSMAGLAFQEIREFRALAYSAQARFVRDPTPAEAGYLVGYVGCQADKTLESIDVMMGLIRDMPHKPERLDALEAALVHSQETRSPGFRELQAQVEQWRWRGLQADPRPDLVRDYQALEFADIERFVAQQIEGRPVTLMVVGDPRRVSLRALERWGEVVRLSVGDVFAP